MKKAVIIFCIIFVLVLAVPAITNAVMQAQEKQQSAQAELATIFADE